MGHSVEKHLAVSPPVYDAEIRRFVPHYETMLDEAVGAVEEHLPHAIEGCLVVDLGAGTGALSALVARRIPRASLVLVDADRAMLEEARSRLAGDLHRIELRHASFSDPLPRCHAAVASLSLHHIHDEVEKASVYRNIFEALEPGGVLVSADATVPADPALSGPIYERWADHLVAHGDTRAQAFERFAQWAKEDRYLGVDVELALLSRAGFDSVEVRFRRGPSTVIVARRCPSSAAP